MRDVGSERIIKRKPRPSKLSKITGETNGAVPRELNDLLDALMEMRNGNFTVRLPVHSAGIAGRIAESFNDICATNQRIAQQLEQVGTIVGKEGKTRQRVKFGVPQGAWAEMESSINTLIDDLLWPTAEVTRAVAAAARINVLRLSRCRRPLRREC
jgi:methyl-accepting chemotaxis protein